MKQTEAIAEQRESGATADLDALFWEQGLRTRMTVYGLSRREQAIAQRPQDVQQILSASWK